MNYKQFDKAQKRILLARLETFYAHTLLEWNKYRNEYGKNHKATTRKLVDRRYRTLLKSIEVVLFKLGSKLFEHGEKPPSIRKTKTLKSENFTNKMFE